MQSDHHEEFMQPLNGLCTACARSVDCVFLDQHKTGVMQCLEFEPFPPRRFPQSLHRIPARLMEEDEKKLGLCCTCEHKDDCTFQKPEGGVWRCEEYC